MSRWVIVRSVDGADPEYLTPSQSWTHDGSCALSCDNVGFMAAIARVFRRRGVAGIGVRAYQPDAHACLAADPPTQPAQAEGEPTAHGTR